MGNDAPGSQPPRTRSRNMERRWEPNGLAHNRQQTDHHYPKLPNTRIRTRQRAPNRRRRSDRTKQNSPRTEHRTDTNHSNPPSTNTCRSAPQRTGTQHQHGIFAWSTTCPTHPQGQHNSGNAIPTRSNDRHESTTTTGSSTTASANRNRHSTAPRRNARRRRLRRAARKYSRITGPTRQEQEQEQEQEPRPHGAAAGWR